MRRLPVLVFAMTLLAAACTTEPKSPPMMLVVGGNNVSVVNRSNFELHYYLVDPDYLARVDLTFAPEDRWRHTIAPFTAIEFPVDSVHGFNVDTHLIAMHQWREVLVGGDVTTRVEDRTVTRKVRVEVGGIVCCGEDTGPPPP